MARPLIKLSELRKVAGLQCTKTEACAFFGITSRTFSQILRSDERALKAWEEGQQQGLISLRRKQMRLASTNSSMAIFLGKQYLGQRDTQTHEHSGRDGGPIQTYDLTKLSRDERKSLRTILNRAADNSTGSRPDADRTGPSRLRRKP